MGYELIISRVSPYSSKARALLGYGGIDYEIRIQNGLTRYTLIRRLTGKTMVPVLRRGEWAINDSTKIAEFAIEKSQRRFLPRPEASVLAWFIEDFADEWMGRWMGYSRWLNEEDSEYVGQVVGRELTGALPIGANLVGRRVAKLLKKKLWSGGVREENERALTNSALRCLEVLETIFAEDPPYLFGSFPTVADFAVYGQLFQYQGDPTGRRKMEKYPAVRRYVARLDAMADRPPGGQWSDEEEADLERLGPLFAEIMGTYWPVLAATHRALVEEGKGAPVIADLIDGSRFRCRASTYGQRRLQEILERVDEAYADRDRLFGDGGVRMERALVGRIADLCQSEAGRDLLRNYDHVGLH